MRGRTPCRPAQYCRGLGPRQESTGVGQAHAPSTALAETGEGRMRFMALSGMIASATFLVACVAHAATVFLVAPCAG
ncbi:MAG: hypothetical protein ABIT20_13925 [Gemmatimonadaceae bacterium]